jgi:hypothetical protein
MENREKIREKNLIPFEKGESGNPNGRPKGQRNYATIYREALIKLATMNGMEPEKMETDILLKGLASARKGDYRFWKDIHDRIHGAAPQRIEQNTNVTIIQPEVQEAMNKALEEVI